MAAGAFAMSFAPIFVRLADVAPTTSAFYRLAIGGGALAVISLRRRPGAGVARGTGLWGIVAVAGVVFALDLAFWHRSIHYIGPGSATILGNFQVFFVAAFGWIVLREGVGARYAAGTTLAFLGLVLLVGGGWGNGGADFRWGVVFGLLTAVMYAAYLIVLQRTQRHPQRLGAFPNMAVISIVGAAGLAVAVGLEGTGFAIPTARDGVLLTAYALIGQVLAWVAVSKGLTYLPASQASLILLVQPTLAFVWDVTLLGRPTAPRELIGAALALAGIYLGMTRRTP